LFDLSERLAELSNRVIPWSVWAGWLMSSGFARRRTPYREPVFAGRPPDITEENVQARIRGVILMALSNKLGSMVLTTGNKS
jgi:NAD synthase